METNILNMISLNGSNYQLWNSRMADLLYVKGFHEPVFSSEKPEGQTNEEWNLLHRQVCGLIRQWVDNNVLYHVSQEVNAHSLWIKLEQMYAQKAITSKLLLIKQLVGLKYSDGNSMSDHLNVFQGIINKLFEMGIEFDDEVQGLWLLATLPDSWETFTFVLNSGPDVISLELAKKSVLNEEAKRNSQGSASCSNDLVVEERGRKRTDKESHNGGETGHNKRFCSREKTEEQKRREKEEAHLYTLIKVACDENLREQIGKTIFFDLVDHNKVHSFRIKNQTSFALFKEEVAKELGIPVQYQRFWLWAKRENKTYRPHRPLAHLEVYQSVGHLRKVSKKTNNAEVNLYLEDSRPIPQPVKTKENILLFFKLYDPIKEELRFVGRLFVNVTGKPTEILTKLNELAGFAPDEEIELFEEVNYKPTVMCEHVDKKLTFQASELEDGDIICFQKRLQVGSVKCRYPDVPSFLDYVRNLQVVRFRSLEKPKEDAFSLQLSKLNSYDDVVQRVAFYLHLVDPSKIRLTSYNCYSQQPKPTSIKYRGENLLDMLTNDDQISNILYYEVLDIPLPELQGLKSLKIFFNHATKSEVIMHTITLPKQSTLGDLISDLKTKVELSHHGAELRLLEIVCNRIYKVFPLNEKIENINDQCWMLRAEEIPDEHKYLCHPERLISVFHFTTYGYKNQVQLLNFGEPFLLVIREGETFGEVKVRLQKKLQVPNEEFSKWKVAVLTLNRPTYVRDSDVVSAVFPSCWEPYLCLEHPIQQTS